MHTVIFTCVFLLDARSLNADDCEALRREALKRAVVPRTGGQNANTGEARRIIDRKLELLGRLANAKTPEERSAIKREMDELGKKLGLGAPVVGGQNGTLEEQIARMPCEELRRRFGSDSEDLKSSPDSTARAADGDRLSTERQIDWSVCKQPNLNSPAHRKAVDGMAQHYAQEARKTYKGQHIAVALNAIYMQMVKDRRALVDDGYLPVGPNRPVSKCALSPGDYNMLIVLRDAAYHVMCRSEVAIGTSSEERRQNSEKAKLYARAYDAFKSSGHDMRIRGDEPTTPPGGSIACANGAEEGLRDPTPAKTETKGFQTRLKIPATEKPATVEVR